MEGPGALVVRTFLLVLGLKSKPYAKLKAGTPPRICATQGATRDSTHSWFARVSRDLSCRNEGMSDWALSGASYQGPLTSDYTPADHAVAISDCSV